MKKSILILFLLISGLTFAQTGERVVVDGKISVPAEDESDGITIMNTDTGRGTVSGVDGKFRLEVGVGDRVVFSAIQFEDFTVIIDQNVVSSRQLNVFITESATELPEVVISSIDLTGNVRVDVNRIPDLEENLPYFSLEEIYNASLTMEPGPLTSPENAAMRNSFMENGLNFANIFRSLFAGQREGDRKNERVDEQLRDLYDDDFFREYLDIERSQIPAFVYFAEDNGLSERMLREGKELELVEFLINQSRRFKAQRQAEAVRE